MYFAGDDDFDVKKTYTKKLTNSAVRNVLDVLNSKPIEAKKLPNGNYQ